jgi:hypothetical protein
MSALGQKQTCAVQTVMSALGQKRTLRMKSVAALCGLRLNGWRHQTRENIGLCEPPHTALV